MKRLTVLAKKSVLSLTMLTLLVLGLGIAYPKVARADAGGAPYVTDVYNVVIDSCLTAVYVYYSNGDHTMYYRNTCN